MRIEEEVTLWIEDIASLCTPELVQLCSGSREEYASLYKAALRLNCGCHTGSVLMGSYPNDISFVESPAFICQHSRDAVESAYNWQDPDQMKRRLFGLFAGAMTGRVMYVVPYATGPIESPMSRFGFEITDSPDVVANMYATTLVGEEFFDLLERKGEIIRGVHTLGQTDGDLSNTALQGEGIHKLTCHFPDTREIWSYGCAPTPRELLHELVPAGL